MSLVYVFTILHFSHILECALSAYKKSKTVSFAVKQKVTLHRQQPHTTCVFSVLDLISYCFV